MEDLNDIFREEEERRLAETAAEIAAEQRRWASLSDAERDALRQAYEAKYAHLDDDPETDDEDDEADEDDWYEGEED